MSNLLKDSTNIRNNFNDDSVSTEDSVSIKDSDSTEVSIQEVEVEENVEIDDIRKRYFVGKIICGKVGKYPWWPCMVNGVYIRPYRTENRPEVLVSYFGIVHDYSYLPENKILDVGTQEEYDKYTIDTVARYGKKGNKVFKCDPRYKKNLTSAWLEAKEASQIDLKSRVKKYGINLETKDSDKKVAKKTIKPKKIVKKPHPEPKPEITTKKEKEPILHGFLKLTLPFRQIKLTEKCCRYCLLTKEVVQCSNRCGSNFHVKCLKILVDRLMISKNDMSKCMECSTDKVTCYACYKDIGDKDQSVQCSESLCRKWYHYQCVYSGPLYEMTKETNRDLLICPRHLCHKCELVSPHPKYKSNKLIVCLMCPATYHTGDWCIPAGSVELTPGEIICPRHLFANCYSNCVVVPPFVARVESTLQKEIYQNKLNSISDSVNISHGRITKQSNVNWCFKCAEGGALLCCETCPSAYHYECTSMTEEPDNFYCVQCVSSCYRSYGEIIWIKCGCYRWWPGQIIHTKIAPKNICSLSHIHGQFIVQFFGTREYMWTDHRKIFVYEEDDMHPLKRDRKSGISRSYLNGIEEAKDAYFARNKAWKTNSSNHVLIPKHYNKITVNKYITPLKRSYSLHQCDCTPDKKSGDCRNGSCINAELKYECNPDSCKMKERCQNQNFTKRNYPLQQVFWTGERGWGLKAKEFIKENQFVNEYVGEVIDLIEAEARTERAKNNNVTDFYYMKLDKNRWIDARDYSNLSRFMNHSCNPNLTTEKWIVNGEGRIGLFALRNIDVGEELTFNYNLYTNSHVKMPCKCNSENCSGFLGEAPKKKTSSTSVNSINSTPPKKLTNRKRKLNELGDSESITNTSSCISFSPEKCDEMTCFRCSKVVDKTKDISCSVEACPQVYHAKCLDLQLESFEKDQWLCPWHFCDVCGRASTQYCFFCTSSVCDEHKKDITFHTVYHTVNICSGHK